MEIIYITQENSVLHRCEEHLILKKKGHTVAEIPLINVKTLVLMNSVQITSHALDVLADKNIYRCDLYVKKR